MFLYILLNMRQKKKLKKFTFFFYGFLILTIIYYLIHIIIIDFPNIISILIELDTSTSVQDTFTAVGLIILMIPIIGEILLSILYTIKYDKNTLFNWKYTKKILSISLFSILICSLVSIGIVYDFLRLFVESFPLDNDLIPAVYFPRFYLVFFFIVSIIIISIGFLLLLKNHFKNFPEYKDLKFPALVIGLLNLFIVSILFLPMS